MYQLELQRVWDSNEDLIASFDIVGYSFRRHALINGLDDIGLTLEHDGHNPARHANDQQVQIAAFEAGSGN